MKMGFIFCFFSLELGVSMPPSLKSWGELGTPRTNYKQRSRLGRLVLWTVMFGVAC